jgi:hypothetical protein
MQWLVACAEDPASCREKWRNEPHQPELMPTGRYFDVVTVGERLGMEAWDLLTRHRLPRGPVVIDHAAAKIGFLVPRSGRQLFHKLISRNAPKGVPYRYLAEGSFFLVPEPEPHRESRYQWLDAPLLRPDATSRRSVALALMLSSATRLLDWVDLCGSFDTHVAPSTTAESELVTASVGHGAAGDSGRKGSVVCRVR